METPGIGCQANFDIPRMFPVSSVTRNDDGIGVQVFIPLYKDAQTQTGVGIPSENVATNTDATGDPSTVLGITGFDDTMFKSFTGVTKSFFEFVVHMIGKNLQPSRKVTSSQKILLFLLKIKLSLTYMVLVGIFGVSNSSPSRFFEEVCDKFYILASENLVFLTKQPSKQECLTVLKLFFQIAPALLIVVKSKLKHPKLKSKNWPFLQITNRGIL